MLRPESAAGFLDAIGRPAVAQLVAAGQLVSSQPLSGADRDGVARVLDAPADALIVEHPRIEFASYAHEWPAEMLLAAGQLTLDLAERLLESGLGLKDATPHNVLFHYSRPLFVDVASIETREPGDATWLPYAQFVRTFVLPLLAHSRFGVPLSQVFLAHRDGLEPEAVYALAGWAQRLSPSFLGSVSLPVWLGGRAGPAPTRSRLDPDPERARFVLGSLFRRLRRQLDTAAPAAARSAWSNYLTTFTYTDQDFARKEAFVRQALAPAVPRQVLDVGCNTGHFSALAAEAGASVVALDLDAASVGRAWRRAHADSLAILPLIANLARPSPGLGWRCAEQRPLIERLAGRSDLVLMLAVLHHLVVTDGIPLADVVELAAELSRDRVLIEYVPPTDPMFRTIARGRDALHEGFTVEVFEAACRPRFETVSMAALDSGRRLYLLAKRRA